MNRRDSPTHLFAADGGLPAVPGESERDPFLVFDELMVVVEALCPVWPDRPGFEGSTRFLL